MQIPGQLPSGCRLLNRVIILPTKKRPQYFPSIIQSSRLCSWCFDEVDSERRGAADSTPPEMIHWIKLDYARYTSAAPYPR